MTPTKHRVAAGILFLLALLVVIGTVRNGLVVDWDFTASIEFGRRPTPFWLVATIFAALGAAAVAAGVWQLRKAAR